jgi:AcrR family transcriptional regulator
MGETIVTDGRAGRGARTREAVVDALLALIDGGNLRPTAREVAEAAGVSLRSVYVHFDDVEALHVAATKRHYERIAGLVTPWDPAGTTAERVDRYVDQRRRLNEHGANIRRSALLQEPFSPVLHSALEQGRLHLRASVEEAFGPELDAVAAAERPRLRAALEVVVGAGTWDNLRHNVGMTADETVALVTDMIHATLRAWDPTRPPRPTDPGSGDPPMDADRPTG